MATAARPRVLASKDAIFLWEGKNRDGKAVRGEMRAASEAVVQTSLRRQGIINARVKKQRFKVGGKVTEKDLTLFTRQLATMMKAGVPLLQSFDIVARGHANPAVSKLLLDIKADVETGSSLSQAFRKYPLYFDALYCNLVEAGEQAGILDTLLERLAAYKEKILAIKGKIKAALFYPISVIVVAFVITAVIMIFVIPAFKDVFKNFGADLPAPTLLVIAISDFFVAYWWAIFGIIFGAFFAFFAAWKRSEKVQMAMDRLLLRAPLFGDIIRKAVIARWTRTLSTMFAAGVPLVESLEAVGGASGNYVYKVASREIQGEVATGTSLTTAMQNTALFPNMVTQMIGVGEATGAMDAMLQKIADFYEEEVDAATKDMLALLEPAIIALLGVCVGGIVISLYMPLFSMIAKLAG